MKQNKQQDELAPYKAFGLSLLQWMALLGLLGILATVAVHYFA